MRATVLALALVLGLASAAPADAKPAGAPTDCAEATTTASILIGHDCGEWATVMIVGRIEIREPWGRSLRPSRAARTRERQPGTGAARAPSRAPEAAETAVMFGYDVSGGDVPNEPDCGEFAYQEDAQDFFECSGSTRRSPSATASPASACSRGAEARAAAGLSAAPMRAELSAAIPGATAGLRERTAFRLDEQRGRASERAAAD